VAIRACADVLRPLIDDPGANPIRDEMTRMACENPEVVGAVGWFAEGLCDGMHALAVAAFVVSMLRAQAEVEELAELEAMLR
jgi:hypothetical protein